jgi:hypothetical protein
MVWEYNRKKTTHFSLGFVIQVKVIKHSDYKSERAAGRITL